MAGRGQRGFTLLEVLVSLLLMLLGLALVAQVLVESGQMLVDAAGEQTDPAAPLLLERLRGDVRAASDFRIGGVPGDCRLRLDGHPAGTVIYRMVGDDLQRVVVAADGSQVETTFWRGVRGFACAMLDLQLLRVEIRYLRRATRRSPLPNLPAFRGPAREERAETLALTPRGGGLGVSW